MKDKLIAKLISDGFAEQYRDKETIFFSRPTKLGAPADMLNENRVYVHVEVDNERAGISVNAHNGDGWCIAEIQNVEHETFIRHSGAFEQKVICAWRELRD